MNYPTPETTKCRKHLAKFCKGVGVDVGFGGEPILLSAICLDWAETDGRRAIHPDPAPTHIEGDATKLETWFREGSLDYIYACHVLEDFADTKGVLEKWLSLLKPGGKLVVSCPDEQAYRKVAGAGRNMAHQHENFSLAFLKEVLEQIGGSKILFEQYPVKEDAFSFYLVAEKL